MTTEKNNTPSDYYFWLGADAEEVVEVTEQEFQDNINNHRQDRLDFLNVK